MPILSYRKLMPMGGGSLVVTVPKAWWKYYGLKAGDEVRVIADGELRIRPAQNKMVNRLRRVRALRQASSINS